MYYSHTHLKKSLILEFSPPPFLKLELPPGGMCAPCSPDIFRRFLQSITFFIPYVLLRLDVNEHKELPEFVLTSCCTAYLSGWYNGSIYPDTCFYSVSFTSFEIAAISMISFQEQFYSFIIQRPQSADNDSYNVCRNCQSNFFFFHLDNYDYLIHRAEGIYVLGFTISATVYLITQAIKSEADLYACIERRN